MRAAAVCWLPAQFCLLSTFLFLPPPKPSSGHKCWPLPKIYEGREGEQNLFFRPLKYRLSSHKDASQLSERIFVVEYDREMLCIISLLNEWHATFCFYCIFMCHVPVFCFWWEWGEPEKTDWVDMFTIWIHCVELLKSLF